MIEVWSILFAALCTGTYNAKVIPPRKYILLNKNKRENFPMRIDELKKFTRFQSTYLHLSDSVIRCSKGIFLYRFKTLPILLDIKQDLGIVSLFSSSVLL